MRDEMLGAWAGLMAIVILAALAAADAVIANTRLGVCERAIRYEMQKTPEEVKAILQREAEREGR